MSIKAQEIVNQQKTLAEQLRQAQAQQAQTSYQQGQRALAGQLRQQRMDSQQARSQMGEQAYMANRSINQGATARGLGNSGLKNLALVQSQIAQGQGLNQLEQRNSEVNRAAMETRLGLSEQLRGTLTGADTQRSQNLIEADKFGLGIEQQNTENLLKLYEMAMSGASTAELSGLASVLGMPMDSMTQEQRSLLEQAVAQPDPLSNARIRHTGRSIFDSVMTGEYGNDMNRQRTFNVNGENIKMSNVEAVKYVSNLYKDKQYMNTHIKVEMRPKDTTVGFVYKGKHYRTYNLAREALEKDLPNR